MQEKEQGKDTSQHWRIDVHILQISKTPELLCDICLIVEEVSIGLFADLGQLPPSSQSFRISLVPMGLLGVLPMALGESQELFQGIDEIGSKSVYPPPYEATSCGDQLTVVILLRSISYTREQMVPVSSSQLTCQRAPARII